jgi:hypothetical protein
MPFSCRPIGLQVFKMHPACRALQFEGDFLKVKQRLPLKRRPTLEQLFSMCRRFRFPVPLNVRLC